MKGHPQGHHHHYCVTSNTPASQLKHLLYRHLFTMAQFSVVVILVTMFACAQGKYIRQTKTVSKEESYLVFPGTKWCGKGNNAMAYDDLGEHNHTDICCRKHDHCPTYIPPFKRRYGLLNFHPMQMSHCSCESKLFDCLWDLQNPIATAVGRLYFNVFRHPCFELVETRVCVKWSFDWWNFNYYCTKYGLQIKAKTLWLKNYLRQFPDKVDRNFSSVTTTASPNTTIAATTSLQHTNSTPTRTAKVTTSAMDISNAGTGGPQRKQSNTAPPKTPTT